MTMGKGHIVMMLVAGAVMFGAGFLMGSMRPDRETEVQVSMQEVQAEHTLAEQNIQIRVNDGEVEWFDGTQWHDVASVEALEKEDKFAAAMEEYELFAQQMNEEKEEQLQEQGMLVQQGGLQLSVGQKEAPKPVATPTPKPSTAAGQTPAAVSTPKPTEAPAAAVTPPAQTGDDSSDDSSDDGGSTSDDTPSDSGDDNSGSGDEGGGDSGGDAGDGGGDTGDSGGDTGDGEDIGWSDDYL